MPRLSIPEAAQMLGVSQQAIHGRIKRDTIAHEKGEDGRTYVYVEDSEMRNGVNNTIVHDYITSLKAEIESLKQDREVRQEEARRKDHLLAAALERIPAIEAADEPRESVVTASDDAAKGAVPTEPEKLSWWRRLFAS